MKRLLACALFMSGCASLTPMTPPVVQIPIGQLALVYAEAHTLHAMIEIRATEWCRAKKLSEADCASLNELNKQATKADAEIRKGILSATGVIDWDKVMEYLAIAIGMIAKVGKAAL